MKQLVYRFAKYTGIFALCRWWTREDIRILAYHGIWLGEGHFGNFLYMSAEKFSARMQKLKSWNVSVLSLGDALSRREQGTLPDGAVVLTIDDGWYGTYLHMMPEIIRHRFPATLYVTSYYVEKQAPVFNVVLQYMISTTKKPQLDLGNMGLINFEGVFALGDFTQRQKAIISLQNYSDDLSEDVERQNLARSLGFELGVSYDDIVDRRLFHLMNGQQVDELKHMGIDIQLHTHRHRTTHGGKSCLLQELRDNRESLSLDHRTEDEHFCYPSGVYNKSDWLLLESANIRSATTTDIGLVGRNTHRYALPRILDGEQVTDLDFEAEMSGFNELSRRALSRIRVR